MSTTTNFAILIVSYYEAKAGKDVTYMKCPCAVAGILSLTFCRFTRALLGRSASGIVIIIFICHLRILLDLTLKFLFLLRWLHVVLSTKIAVAAYYKLIDI